MILNIAIGYFFIGYNLVVFIPMQQNIIYDLGWTSENKELYDEFPKIPK